LHGVELIAQRVEVARERVPGADVRRGDARELPFADGSIALVTLLTCLSSMPEREDVDRALTEVSRVLAPGGLTLVYEPRIANPFNRATRRVSISKLRGGLGERRSTLTLTGLPPLARRLGPGARRYGTLSNIASTHRISAFTPG
jgi:ubiquinone/menaquinone biosynthesis C-methylase UbiE